MKLKILAAIAALSMTLPASSATPLPPPATASIDWTTFTYTLVNITGSTPNTDDITFSGLSSNVNASSTAYDSNSASDWISSLEATDGVASATANDSSLNAQFTALPTILNSSAWADRNGSFTLAPNTIVTFYVDASTSIKLDRPPNGDAYAWTYLGVDGPGVRGGDNRQHADGQIISWASGSENAVSDASTLEATFLNLTSASMTGTLTAFATVNQSGFIPVIPEPRTYAMMLAGLGLLGFVARRRKLAAIPS